MKRMLPYLAYGIFYVALLVIDTYQISSAYDEIAGEGSERFPSWAALFVINAMILVLSFHRKEPRVEQIGKAYRNEKFTLQPHQVFAGLTFLLHIGFWHIKVMNGDLSEVFRLPDGDEIQVFSAPYLFGMVWGSLLSGIICFSAYFLSNALYQVHKEQQEKSKTEQDLSKSLQEQIKAYEEHSKEMQEVIKRMGEWVRHGNGYARNVWNGEEFVYEWISSKDYEKQGSASTDQEIG